MTNEVKKILSKLGLVMNPVFLVMLIGDLKRFFNQNPVNYPSADDFKMLYLKVDEKVYLISEGHATLSTSLPYSAHLICISQSALEKMGKLIGITESDNEKLVNQLLKKLRQKENIKNYASFLDTAEDSFSTNLSLSQLIKITINQIKG